MTKINISGCAAGLLVLSLFFTGCNQSGYLQFYNAGDPSVLQNITPLGPDEEPELVIVDNLDDEVHRYRTKGYDIIGKSAFNGLSEGLEGIGAIKKAKEVGATLILLSHRHTETRRVDTSITMPNNQTTYHSGTVNGGNSYATYSGTSTSYGTKQVPISYNIRRYDQTAIYMAKMKKGSMKFGVAFQDLTTSQRREIERNNGAYVGIVYEGYPAFRSNILVGDIIISIDDKDISNMEHATRLIKALPVGRKSVDVVLIRKGKIKKINVIL